MIEWVTIVKSLEKIYELEEWAIPTSTEVPKWFLTKFIFVVSILKEIQDNSKNVLSQIPPIEISINIKNSEEQNFQSSGEENSSRI